MPRRIIYIQNPKEGSHFRTIGGGSTSPRTPRPPRAPKPPKPPTNSTPTGSVLTGGAIYNTPDSQWYISNAASAPHYFGELPGYGISFDTDNSFPIPETWGNRELRGWELLASVAILGTAAFPGGAALLAPYGSVEAQTATEFVSYVKLQIIIQGARGNLVGTGSVIAAGIETNINDAPRVVRDRATGGYRLEYADLVSSILRENDYRYNE